MTGAALVGGVTAPMCAYAVVVLAFGVVALGVAAGGVVTAVTVVLLAAIHQATPLDARRPQVLRSLGWGTGVFLASVGLIGGCALAWQLSDADFGRSLTPWWLASGVGVALVAAAGTRRTAVPAGLLLLALAAGAIVNSGLPGRGTSAVGTGPDTGRRLPG